MQVLIPHVTCTKSSFHLNKKKMFNCHYVLVFPILKEKEGFLENSVYFNWFIVNSFPVPGINSETDFRHKVRPTEFFNSHASTSAVVMDYFPKIC